MSRSQWFTSPFKHVKYALVRNKKDAKSIGIPFGQLSPSGKGSASLNFLEDESGEVLLVVYFPKSKMSSLFTESLLCHESIHIWQEIKLLMGEEKPSAEFEAYSIQLIFQDLLYTLRGE